MLKASTTFVFFKATNEPMVKSGMSEDQLNDLPSANTRLEGFPEAVRH